MSAQRLTTRERLVRDSTGWRKFVTPVRNGIRFVAMLVVCGVRGHEWQYPAFVRVMVRHCHRCRRMERL